MRVGNISFRYISMIIGYFLIINVFRFKSWYENCGFFNWIYVFTFILLLMMVGLERDVLV